MDKFIIFKLKDVTAAGASVSDDGTGIEIISLPVKSISHMTASKGKVNIFYNDVSRYDQSSLSTGESMQKSFVVISCEDGEEFATIESISNFSGLREGSKALVFDAEDQGVISAVLHAHPVNRVTGKTSVVTDSGFTAVSSNTINDIDFGAADNKPILDLDSRDAVFGGGGGNISAWANAGTGGSDYDFLSVTGSVINGSGNPSSNFKNIKTALFQVDSYITLANSLPVYNEYTMYMVYSNGTKATTSEAPIIYGVDAGGTSGGIGIASRVDNIKSNIKNRIGISYEDRYGEASSSETFVSLGEITPCVLVIRRDKDFNVSVYNANGDLVASIPAVVDNPEQGSLNVKNGETSGTLEVNHIGSASENTTHSFSGRLGRFGVIARDIGPVESQRIAKELYELYSL
tara:strand:- start:1915 stop:3126 length:1212 start_codon:yes stop_codon:yes gene_type:complete